MAGQNILTTEQKKALSLVTAEPLLADFYLSGGTALSAFYLHHRLSDDLDFFSPEPIDTLFIHTFMKKLQRELHATHLRYERVFDRNIFFFKLKNIKIKQLKVEFTPYPFTQLEAVKEKNGVRVDSLIDLAANKLIALIDRFDPKDFVDIYFLLQRFSLQEIKKQAEKKFDMTIGPMLLGSEFAKVRRIEALPIMLKPLAVSRLKEFFSKQVKQIGAGLIK